MCSKPVPCFAAEVSGNLKAIYVVPQVITDYYGCCGVTRQAVSTKQKLANRNRWGLLLVLGNLN